MKTDLPPPPPPDPATIRLFQMFETNWNRTLQNLHFPVGFTRTVKEASEFGLHRMCIHIILKRANFEHILNAAVYVMPSSQQSRIIITIRPRLSLTPSAKWCKMNSSMFDIAPVITFQQVAHIVESCFISCTQSCLIILLQWSRVSDLFEQMMPTPHVNQA